MTGAYLGGRPWLSVIGIGEDGAAGLGGAARQALGEARAVFGGARHLQLAAPLFGAGAAVAEWPRPFSVAAVLARRGEAVAVLASGDPMFHGVGTTLARQVPAAEMVVLPQPSCVTLAAARLCWSLEDVTTLSQLTKPPETVLPHARDGARLMVLTADAAGPATLAETLVAHGFGASRLTVCEALGGPSERIRTGTAHGFDLDDIHALNLVAVEVAASDAARLIPDAPGLPDGWFAHDGQLTRREGRALALAALAPQPGELLWDLGAGAGSVAIEWLLTGPRQRAIAVERVAERAERIGANARALGVPHLAVVCGNVSGAMADLPAPDAVFVGGGADAKVLEGARAALRPGGRLVVHAVTLETEALLLAAHAAHGGELLRVALSRAAPVGHRTGWRPAMPLTQWAFVR